MPTEIIAGMLPANEVSLLAGASGAGKTTLIMQMLKAIQERQSVFGYEAKSPIRIGYIAADRTWDAYVKTALHVGLNVEEIKILSLVDSPLVDLAGFESKPIEELERLILTMLPVDLLVVDPLIVFLGVDTNKYHLNAARLIRLNRFCRAHQLTILGTHHASKARSDFSFQRAQDRISGSAALLGFTSTQLFLAHPDETKRDDGCFEWHIISHHAAPKIILLSRSEDGVFRLEGEESSTGKSVEEKVLNILGELSTPMATGDIISVLVGSHSVRAIERAIQTLHEQGQISRPLRGAYQIVPQVRH